MQQGKQILRGLKPRGNAAVLNLASGDSLDIRIDWSAWLGSDTIASVSNDVTGVQISSASNTPTTATLFLSGQNSGWLEHRITTTAGRIKQQMIFVEIGGFPVSDDYGRNFRFWPT